MSAEIPHRNQFVGSAKRIISFSGLCSLIFAVLVLSSAESSGQSQGQRVSSPAVAPKADIKLSPANEARIAAIHRGGEPTTLSELNSWYATPATNQNAAPIYAQAFEALSETAQLPTFLSNNQRSLALLHQAA